MFDHVTIRVSDRAASEHFYDTVLPILGTERTQSGEQFTEWNEFSLAAAGAEKPVTRRLHIGFAAPSREHVDRFWQAGIDAGFRDDGAPGPRPQYSEDYYGAFLLDPDGNSAEAVHHGSIRDRGSIDHLWLRVSDLEASTQFYETVAPAAGFRTGRGHPNRTSFACVSGGFSIVSDGSAPTQHAHIAFTTADKETVDRFHREATAAGYRDNGPPGERPIYHEGYYGAFVLDPDGNNIEVVNHNRQ